MHLGAKLLMPSNVLSSSVGYVLLRSSGKSSLKRSVAGVIVLPSGVSWFWNNGEGLHNESDGGDGRHFRDAPIVDPEDWLDVVVYEHTSICPVSCNVRVHEGFSTIKRHQCLPSNMLMRPMS